MISIKLFLRQIKHNRLHNLLNIVGLAIGISACWMIFRIVNYEFNFDKNTSESNKIYKIHASYLENGVVNDFDGTPAPLAAYFKSNIANIDLTIPIFNEQVERVIYSTKNNKEKQVEDQSYIVSTTNDYFQLLDYKWLAGNPKNALSDPNSVVLSSSRAKQYFADTPVSDLIGRTIRYDSTTYTISGVVQDLAYPSSFVGKEFIKIKDKNWNSTEWTSANSEYQLYIKLKNEQDLSSVLRIANQKFTEMTQKEFSEYGLKGSIKAIPLGEVHFTSFVNNHSDKKTLYGLIGIGIFLLLLACFNYINLTTAQIPQRSNELGIRKTLGEEQSEIAKSFLFEALFISIAAVLLSIPLVHFLEKFLRQYLPENINQYADITPVALFLVGLVILISTICSIYPAILANKVKVVTALKIGNAQQVKVGSISIRKILIVFQFLIAQLFVVSTCIVAMQLNYAMRSNNGFSSDGIISLYLPTKSYQNSNVDPFYQQYRRDFLGSDSSIKYAHGKYDFPNRR